MNEIQNHNEEDFFAQAIEYFAATTQGEAAKELLRKGIPIYYGEQDTPENCLIKEYPSGKKELIKYNLQKNTEEVIKIL